MTSNTTPEGIVSASAYDSGYPAWHAFDRDASTVWNERATKPKWIDYEFDTSIPIARMYFKFYNLDKNYLEDTAVELFGSNDGVSYTSIKQISNADLTAEYTTDFPLTASYKHYRLYIYCAVYHNLFGFHEVQFYGREDV